MSCKIVFYGPGLSGKTTNIQRIHEQMPAPRKGELTSIKTEGDRTLFFDFMSLDLGKVGGMETRFQIYTVPGQVYYNATRKLVLQGADGIVFVADSGPDCMETNVESWQNLKDNLAERGLDITDLPVVIQWNKRDLPGAIPVDELNARINDIGAPTFEAVATEGPGVLDTLKCVCGLVCRQLNARQQKFMSSASTGAATKSASTGAPTRSTSETTKPAPQAAPAAASVATAVPPVPVASAPATAGSMRFVNRRSAAAGAVTATQVHEKKDITAGRTSADATAPMPPV
ncbi:MAG TPA: hypothetical protein VMX57_09565, partial [Planctomycetota bacterium]|nr:hypothetical protein [Planctomycetota bacterium]